MQDHTVTRPAPIESLEARECFSADLAGFSAFGGFHGGVRVAVGDVNGDNPAVLTVDVWEHAAKSGHSGGVNVLMADGSVRFLKSTVTPGTAGFRGGVSVAVGDVTGDGAAATPTGTVTFIIDGTSQASAIKSPRDAASGQIVFDTSTQRLQPLIAGANTDFDGDQMAHHLPLSIDAQMAKGTFSVSMIYTF